MSSTEAQVFTLPEAAKALGLSVKTLRKRAQQEASEAQAQGREPAAFLARPQRGAALGSDCEAF
jgi:Sec-independent protein translocase protein TatA